MYRRKKCRWEKKRPKSNKIKSAKVQAGRHRRGGLGRNGKTAKGPTDSVRIEKREGAEVWHGEAKQQHSDTAFVVSL